MFYSLRSINVTVHTIFYLYNSDKHLIRNNTCSLIKNNAVDINKTFK